MKLLGAGDRVEVRVKDQIYVGEVEKILVPLPGSSSTIAIVKTLESKFFLAQSPGAVLFLSSVSWVDIDSIKLLDLWKFECRCGKFVSTEWGFFVRHHEPESSAFCQWGGTLAQE